MPGDSPYPEAPRDGCEGDDDESRESHEISVGR